MTGRGKLSDAELSKKLGHYQKMSRIWILVGLFGALSGTVSYFAVQDTALKAILTGVLFFGGVCCAVFLGGSAQKKLQALIQEQFGDFFRAEWEKAFGPDVHTPEMCVDEPFLRTFHLLDGQWEECTVENFHEGDYRGVHFSAANVRTMCMSEGAVTKAMRPATRWSSKASCCAAKRRRPPPPPSSSTQGRRTVRAAQRRAMRCLTDASASQQSRSRMPSPFLPRSLWS